MNSSSSVIIVTLIVLVFIIVNKLRGKDNSYKNSDEYNELD